MRYLVITLLLVGTIPVLSLTSFEADQGSFEYDDFKTPKNCALCHKEIYREWQQSLMAQSFTHKWDDIEYFKLALPHAGQLEKVAGVKAGCIGCHAPLAFLAGDIPPKPPAEGTRANEGVSCDLCHAITGSTEPEPFNFSFVVNPGKVKYGNRKETNKSSFHKTAYSEFQVSPKLCACCHDEQSPYGAWVKRTYREWKAGPYAKEGVRCQDCHMYHAPGRSTSKGMERADMAHHNFHGVHHPGKSAGAVDLALYTAKDSVSRGGKFAMTANLFNGKVGHMIPSGSSEERMLWLEVKVTDSAGKVWPLAVEKKGFPGEEYTIADPEAIAYQAMGEIMGIDGFKGVARDPGVPAGSRIFRRPFFDPEGRMTICQWFTAENDRIDYRIAPRETKIETFIWNVPDDAAPGRATINAAILYSMVPRSVCEFLGLPDSEWKPIKVNEASIEVKVE